MQILAKWFVVNKLYNKYLNISIKNSAYLV
uniref:Uncharacterized protein n=1 Tax=Siphoviridae sp. ctCb814 TaxID=2827808 RepID=A0A8S5SNI9_9CAUD|nr:MAG TPA: hypothetical protein [Siphoviridae sp. ctCb814]